MRRILFYLTLALVLILGACAQPPQPTEPENHDDLSSTAFGGTGLTGVYFDNMDFTGTQKTRVETVNKSWTGDPITGIAGTTYSVRWTGQIVPVYTEEYTFHVIHTDGARLMINGQTLFNNWKDQAQVTDSGKIMLQAGVKYDIRLEYYRNATNPSLVRLQWQSARQARQVVPADNLFPDTAISVIEADIASISIKPESVVLTPGEIRLVRVRFLDKDKKDLGPATSNLTQLNLLGAGYQVKWAGNGYLHVIAPTSTQSNVTYSAKLTSRPAVFATATAAVVPVKAGVVLISESSVIFPRTDYNFPTNADASSLITQMVGSFTDTEIAQAATQTTDTMPVSPVVVREAGLPAISQGSLVSGLGATQIYGQVKSIVARRDGKVLLAVQLVNPSTVFDNLPAYQQNYTQLVNGGVMPTTITGRLTLKDVQVPGQIRTQGVGASCTTGLFNVDVTWQTNVNLGTNPTVDVGGEMTISGNYPFTNLTCEGYLEQRIPAPFPWNIVLDPKIRGTLEISIGASNDEGAETPTLNVRLIYDAPIYPQGQPSSEIDVNSTLINPAPNNNFFDVTGQKIFYRASITSKLKVGLVVESFGRVDEAIDDVLKVDGGTVAAGKLQNWANVLDLFQLYLYGYGEYKITGQLASMRSALENASSKIYRKPSAGLAIELSGAIGVGFKGFLAEILGFNLDLSTVLWEGPAIETLPGSLTATITSNDKNGNATIGISTNSSLSKIQLGYIPANSLHGQTVGITGGSVTYNLQECLDAGNVLPAKVVAIGKLPLLPLGAPFNPQQELWFVCGTAQIKFFGGAFTARIYGVANKCAGPNTGEVHIEAIWDVYVPFYRSPYDEYYFACGTNVNGFDTVPSGRSSAFTAWSKNNLQDAFTAFMALIPTTEQSKWSKPFVIVKSSCEPNLPRYEACYYALYQP